jgi:hypothetical protein
MSVPLRTGIILGLDMGGTRLAGGLVDFTGAVHEQCREPSGRIAAVRPDSASRPLSASPNDPGTVS